MPYVRVESPLLRLASPPGTRVLVDRSLPLPLRARGAAPPLWLPSLAPPAALARWYLETSAPFASFRERYAAGLQQEPGLGALRRLRVLAMSSPLVLLTSAVPTHLSHAAVLADLLRPRSSEQDRQEGGDPSCWLHRVCPECGRVAEGAGPGSCAHHRSGGGGGGLGRAPDGAGTAPSGEAAAGF
ncbi:DUF488 domain-containing protein [Streptomyces sp. NPDC059740]|uniref:DUF488 domain-containing protein n=1 Tax=Streptomyces sp. NPDC059740 TaxID=3346926 RepID=UPI003648E8ED